MSFEGYYQFLCKNDHLHEEDVVGGLPNSFSCDRLVDGQKCGAEIADKTINLVDDTNVDAHGYRKPIEIQAAVKVTCNLGHAHITSAAKFRLSEKTYYWDGEKYIECSHA